MFHERQPFSCLATNASPRFKPAFTRLEQPALASAKIIAAALLCLSLVLGSAAWAQLPTAQLTDIFPPGGKVGTTFDVELAGTDLDDAGQLVFSHPGITAVQKTGAPTALSKTPPPLPRQFTVTIAAAVPAGVYEARTVGRYGASNPRAFSVGTLNEVVVKDPPSAAAKAKLVPLESVVDAAVRAEQADYYKFTAHKGQRVLIDCCARRIDSRLDASLVLFDASGRELARNKERIHRDPFVDFRVPADGSYVLKIYDFLYKGGAEYFYRLTLSTAPYLDFVMPPVGRPGSKEKYTLFGRNLPGGVAANVYTADGKPLDQLEVEIALPDEAATAASSPPPATLQPPRLVDPTEAAQDAFSYRLPPPLGPSINAVDIFYSSFPIVRSQKPNDTPAQAQKVQPPCEVVGQFNPRGDQDWYAFDAKKGDVFWIEVYSQRLGLPTDPYLLVQRAVIGADGKETLSDVAEIDDPQPTPKHDRFETHYAFERNDPVLRFAAPEDGSYRVLVRDLYFESRGNPSYVYRLAIRRATPDFQLTAVVESPLEQQNLNQTRVWSPLLHKGEITGVTVMAGRQDNFGGEINLTVEGLPPGVTCPGATIGPGADVGTLVFSAAEKIDPWAGPIKVVGHAQIGGHEVTHAAHIGTVVWGTQNRDQELARFRVTSQMFVAVSPTDIPMVKVELGGGKDWDTAVGGKLQIPVKITRHGEFKGRLKLQPAGLPREITVPDLDIAEGATEGKLDVTVRNLPAGDYTLSCRVDTRFSYRHNPEAATAAQIAAKAMEKIAADAAAATQKATAAKAAADQAATATAAAAKQATDALAAAQQKAKDAAAKLKTANDGKDAAAKTAAATALDTAKAAQTKAEAGVAETAGKAKAAADVKTAAEAALRDATAKSQAAEAEKQAAANRARDTATAAQPRDINVVFYSTPMQLKIAAAPVMLSVTPPAQPIKAGGHSEVPFTVKRLYGFGDVVYVGLASPPGVVGARAGDVTVAAAQTDGKLNLELDPSAPPGDQTVQLRTRLNFNGQAVQFDQPLAIKILPADKKK